MNVFDLMKSLSESRPLFHSEADFQHAFAWKMHQSMPEVQIYLEAPIRSTLGTTYVDIIARVNGAEIAIELKYKTRALDHQFDGSDYILKSHAAQDLGRYDFYKDIARVETFAKSAGNRRGYAIFLTNDSAYWKESSRADCGYAKFAMHHGRDAYGNLAWGDRASAGTRKGRESEIVLGGNYKLVWLPYSTLRVKGYSDFRYLCLQIGAS